MEYKKTKKLRYDRLLFCIAAILFVGFGITKILARPDPYKEYKEVSSENKQVGEEESIIDEEDETKLQFLHYPTFQQEQMDQQILEVVHALPKQEGITFLDYESDGILGKYWSVSLHYQHLNLDKELQEEHDYHFTFHKDNGEIVKLEDVCRRNYHDMLKEQFKKQANLTLENTDDLTFTIGEDALEVANQDAKITLPYETFKPYIKIEGKGIAETYVEVKRTVEIDPNKPMIALTFDDGPTPYTDDFMQVFEQYNATASFFMLGQNIQYYPDTIQHMVENGFEICNHSWDHKSIASDDLAHINQEIFDTQDLLYQMTGHEPTRVRPPYGAYNENTQQATNDNGLHITLWNVDTEDWSNRDKDITLAQAKAGARDGAIILFHDLYPSSLEAIKELIPYLQAQGYQLVTVSDLFKYKGDLTGL